MVAIFTTHYCLPIGLLLIGLTIPSSIGKTCHPNDVDCTYTQLTDVNIQEEGWTKCIRECDGKPLTCYYKIYVEPYTVMGPACGECPHNKTACLDPQCVTADGVERGILAYNRQIPGPSIQVCRGDKIVVDLINADAHRSTSVHWHGIRQIGSPFSDGVPMVTQCPINPGETFRYQFTATEPGSYFYHSHSGIQKIDGLSGPLVVRDQKSKEPFGDQYDNDLPQHVVYIQDWVHTGADEKVPGVRKGPNGGSMPRTYLINGKGIYVGSTTDPQNLISQVNSPSQPQISEFTVKKGKRYRFRIIGSTCLVCTVKVTIQGHTMKVIHADGAGPVHPTEVDGVTLNSGDRFDVIVEANKQADSYWILAHGQCSCNNVMQLALLKYEDSNPVPSSNLPLERYNGVILNPSNPTCNVSQEMCVSKLRGPIAAPRTVTDVVGNVRLLFQFGFHFYSKNELFQSGQYNPYFEPAAPLLVRAQINAITNKLYPSPLLSQYHDIPDEAFCSKRCHTEHLDCVCLNVYKIPLNSVVDIIIIDTATHSKTGLTHPFHLHGHNFYVVKEGVFANGVDKGLEELNHWLDEGAMVNSTFAVQKDSIGVPSGGYAVIRFVADNPGFWILHCHFTLHLDLGMSAILQVGEVHEMPKPPKGYPKCGNFIPKINF